MATTRKSDEEFIQTMLKNNKREGHDAPVCRFVHCEISSLLHMHKQICGSGNQPVIKMDRERFRDELHKRFSITEDFLMDRVFRAFDRDNDGFLKAEEWIYGLSVFLRGDLEEQIKHCFKVYDLNGDGIISREEMFHLLKNCQIKQGMEEDPDESVKDLVEIFLKKVDVDHDGRCSLQDFSTAVNANHLLLEGLGPCLPNRKSSENFLKLIEGNLNSGSSMHPEKEKNEANRIQTKNNRTKNVQMKV